MLPLCILSLIDEDDRAFMTRLYLTHRGLMYAKARALLHERQDIEDVISQACIALIGKISLIRNLDCYASRAYIVSTIRNTAINFIMRRDRSGKYAFLDGDGALDGVCSDEPDFLSALIRREDINRLKAALRMLDERDRAVLTMKYFDEMSDHEIADVLGIKPDSVRTCLMRARRRVLERIKE